MIGELPLEDMITSTKASPTFSAQCEAPPSQPSGLPKVTRAAKAVLSDH